MSMPSPYAPPEKDIATHLPETISDLRDVRAILYIHIAAESWGRGIMESWGHPSIASNLAKV